MLAQSVGILVYGALLALGVRAITVSARRHLILTPVIVAFTLRVAVMATVHIASLVSGDGGTLFVDDITYLQTGRLLAEEWGAGRLADPSSVAYGGTNQFGFHLLTGFVFTLTGGSVFAVKLANVVLGTGTVLLTAVLAHHWFGAEARGRVAWLAAVLPGLVWWSAPMLKEGLTAFLLVATLVALTRATHPRWMFGCAALLGALALTRISAAGAVAIGITAGLSVAAIRDPRGVNWRALALWALTLGVVAVGAIAFLARGNPGAFLGQYENTVKSMVDLYRGSSFDLLGLDVFRTFVAPYPWVFTEATNNWDRGLYPGVWALYLLVPAIILGAWRLIRVPEGVLLLVLIAAYTLANAATTGFAFRQRGTIEPLLVLLVAYSGRSWRELARLGAVALVVVAISATVQSGSAVAGALILAAAVAVAWISARLPAKRLALETPHSLAALVGALSPPQPRIAARVAGVSTALARALAPRPRIDPLRPVWLEGGQRVSMVARASAPPAPTPTWRPRPSLARARHGAPRLVPARAVKLYSLQDATRAVIKLRRLVSAAGRGWVGARELAPSLRPAGNGGFLGSTFRLARAAALATDAPPPAPGSPLRVGGAGIRRTGHARQAAPPLVSLRALALPRLPDGGRVLVFLRRLASGAERGWVAARRVAPAVVPVALGRLVRPDDEGAWEAGRARTEGPALVPLRVLTLPDAQRVVVLLRGAASEARRRSREARGMAPVVRPVAPSRFARHRVGSSWVAGRARAGGPALVPLRVLILPDAQRVVVLLRGAASEARRRSRAARRMAPVAVPVTTGRFVRPGDAGEWLTGLAREAAPAVVPVRVVELPDTRRVVVLLRGVASEVRRLSVDARGMAPRTAPAARGRFIRAADPGGRPVARALEGTPPLIPLPASALRGLLDARHGAAWLSRTVSIARHGWLRARWLAPPVVPLAASRLNADPVRATAPRIDADAARRVEVRANSAVRGARFARDVSPPSRVRSLGRVWTSRALNVASELSPDEPVPASVSDALAGLGPAALNLSRELSPPFDRQSR